MRDYRGKRLDGKGWVYGWLSMGGSELYTKYDPKKAYISEAIEVLNRIEVDPATVEQQVGLKDVDGVEIYEGDIVKAKGFCNPDTFLIEYIEGAHCCIHPTIKGWPIDINIMYPSIGCQIKIIGSKTDNPELMEVK